MLTALPLGPRTDLQILGLHGAVIRYAGDHLVIRSPHSPRFHWGNFVQVTAGDPNDAQHWLEVFAAEFPDADYVALGLPSLPEPNAIDRYAAQQVSVSTDDVLSTRRLPDQRPLPDGYTARRLTSEADWEQAVTLDLAENAATGRYDAVAHEIFVRDQVAARRDLVDRGAARWFGAFADEQLVSNLGIVVLGDTARYQSVGTSTAHRRRGLAGHLLGLAARWAADQGAKEYVIVTESTNEARRLYRSMGFVEDVKVVTAYRGGVDA